LVVGRAEIFMELSIVMAVIIKHLTIQMASRVFRVKSEPNLAVTDIKVTSASEIIMNNRIVEVN